MQDRPKVAYDIANMINHTAMVNVYNNIVSSYRIVIVVTKSIRWKTMKAKIIGM